MVFPKNETTIGKINLLSRWIIFHSIIYYEMNKSLVTDYMFDNNAKELYKMMAGMYKPVENKMLEYALKMKPDFIKKYKKFSYMKKICILDKYASEVLGL